MLLDFIARYYKFLWIAFVAVGFAKIILSFSFNQNLRGIHGILYGLFKWYNEDEQEMEDQEVRRTTMRMHNIITLAIYSIITVIIFTTMFLKYIGNR